MEVNLEKRLGELEQKFLDERREAEDVLDRQERKKRELRLKIKTLKCKLLQQHFGSSKTDDGVVKSVSQAILPQDRSVEALLRKQLSLFSQKAQEANEAIEDLKIEISEAETRKGNLRRTIGGENVVEDTLMELIKQKCFLERKVSTKEQKFNSILSEVKSRIIEISQLENDIALCKEEFHSCEKENEELESRKQIGLETIGMNRKLVEVKKKEIEESKQEILRLEDSSMALENEVCKLGKQISSLVLQGQTIIEFEHRRRSLLALEQRYSDRLGKSRNESSRSDSIGVKSEEAHVFDQIRGLFPRLPASKALQQQDAIAVQNISEEKERHEKRMNRSIDRLKTGLAEVKKKAVALKESHRSLEETRTAVIGLLKPEIKMGSTQCSVEIASSVNQEVFGHMNRG